jgi:hypothetical protein
LKKRFPNNNLTLYVLLLKQLLKVSYCAAATTNPYKIVLPWLSMQLGKLGLGETGFFEAQGEQTAPIQQKFFSIREVEKKNGA